MYLWKPICDSSCKMSSEIKNTLFVTEKLFLLLFSFLSFFSLLSRPGFSNLRWRDWLLLFSASLPLCLQTATTSSLVFVISFILYFYIRPLYLFNIWFSGLVRLTCVVFRPMAFPSVHSNKAHLFTLLYFFVS